MSTNAHYDVIIIGSGAGAVNPTLTIVAQTLRVADFIKNKVF